MSISAKNNGNVSGPTSATDNTVARYDGTTGRIIQGSSVAIDDSNNISTPGGITVNSGNANADSHFHGQTLNDVFFIDASRDAAAMGTQVTSYNIDGANILPTLAMLRKDASTAINQVLWSNSNTASRGPFNNFLRSRNSSGTDIVVASGDTIGNFRFSGHDGTGFISGAQIVGSVTATPSTGIVPTALFFYTMDGAGSFGRRMVITAAGRVNIGTSSIPDSTFEVTGSNGRTVTTLSAATLTLDDTMSSILVDYTTTGTVTITLPSAASAFNSQANNGRIYVIKDKVGNAAANNITINRAGSDTIDGATSQAITTNYGFIVLQAVSNTEWAVIG